MLANGLLINLSTPLRPRFANMANIASDTHSNTIHPKIKPMMSNAKFIASNKAVTLLAMATAKNTQLIYKSLRPSFLLILSLLSVLYFLIM